MLRVKLEGLELEWEPESQESHTKTENRLSHQKGLSSWQEVRIGMHVMMVYRVEAQLPEKRPQAGPGWKGKSQLQSQVASGEPESQGPGATLPWLSSPPTTRCPGRGRNVYRQDTTQEGLWIQGSHTPPQNRRAEEPGWSWGVRAGDRQGVGGGKGAWGPDPGQQHSDSASRESLQGCRIPNGCVPMGWD